MSTAQPAPDHDGSNALSPLREVLAGEMGAKYGALPVVQIPQDDEPLLGFVKELAEILIDKGIYRRGTMVVVPFMEDRSLIMMEAKTFCSWVQHYVMGAKTKWTRDGHPKTVYKDIPTDVAEKVLMSLSFWPKLWKIEAVQPAPLPALRDGELVLMDEGYDRPTQTYTFPLA